MKALILIGFWGACMISALIAQPGLKEIEQMIEQEEYELVNRLLDSLIVNNPKQPGLYYWKGISQYKQEHYEAARNSFNKGIRVRRGFGYNYVGLGMVLLREGSYEQAEKSLNKALKFNHKDVGISYAVAKAYLEERSENSIAVAEKMLKDVTPFYEFYESAEMPYLWTNCKQTKNIYPTHYHMSLCFSEAEINSSCAAGYVCMAKIYIQERDYDSATKMLSEAFRIDSAFSPVYQQMGELGIKNHDFDHARDCYQKYIELSGGSYYDLQRFASSLLLAEEFQESIHVLNSLDSIPDLGWRLKGVAHLKLGNVDSALHCMKTYFSRTKGTYRIPLDYHTMGMALYEDGEVEAATSHFHQANEMDSDQHFLWKELADEYKVKKKFQHEAYFRQLYLGCLTSPTLRDYYFLGVAQYKSGQYYEGDSTFEVLLGLRPEFTAAHFYRLRIAEKLDSDTTQWLVIPHAQEIIRHIGDKRMKNLKAVEKSQLKTCYHLMTRYHFDEQSDGTGNCEAARPWLEKALLFDPEHEELLGIRAKCTP